MTGTGVYATNAELKEEFSIGDAVDDTLITNVGLSASRLIDAWTGRPGFDKDTSATARRPIAASYDGSKLYVHDFWDTALLVVQTDDNSDGTFETTWTVNTDYYLEPFDGVRDGIVGHPYCEIWTTTTRTWPYGAWPSVTYGVPSLRGIQVTAKWGWAAVPQAVHQACLILGARLFEERKAPFGIDTMGIYIGRDRMSQVSDMLAPFRRAAVNAPFA